jgi:hypothetical protein
VRVCGTKKIFLQKATKEIKILTDSKNPFVFLRFLLLFQIFEGRLEAWHREPA